MNTNIDFWLIRDCSRQRKRKQNRNSEDGAFFTQHRLSHRPVIASACASNITVDFNIVNYFKFLACAPLSAFALCDDFVSYSVIFPAIIASLGRDGPSFKFPQEICMPYGNCLSLVSIEESPALVLPTTCAPCAGAVVVDPVAGQSVNGSPTFATVDVIVPRCSGVAAPRADGHLVHVHSACRACSWQVRAAGNFLDRWSFAWFHRHFAPLHFSYSIHRS